MSFWGLCTRLGQRKACSGSALLQAILGVCSTLAWLERWSQSKWLYPCNFTNRYLICTSWWSYMVFQQVYKLFAIECGCMVQVIWCLQMGGWWSPPSVRIRLAPKSICSQFSFVARKTTRIFLVMFLWSFLNYRQEFFAKLEMTACQRVFNNLGEL